MLSVLIGKMTSDEYKVFSGSIYIFRKSEKRLIWGKLNFMPKCTRLLLVLLLLAGIAKAQTPAPPPYHKYSRRELSEVKSGYESLSKEFKEVQKNRQALENALRAYDAKIKLFSDQMAALEQRVDNGLGAYSGDPKYLLATRQVEAARMSYSLQSIQLLSNVTNEQLQLNTAFGNLDDKYNTLMKMKGSGR